MTATLWVMIAGGVRWVAATEVVMVVSVLVCCGGCAGRRWGAGESAEGGRSTPESPGR